MNIILARFSLTLIVAKVLAKTHQDIVIIVDREMGRLPAELPRKSAQTRTRVLFGVLKEVSDDVMHYY